MAIADTLVARNADDLDVNRWLPVDEVLRRIVERFPLAVVDRKRGDRMVQETMVKLVEVSAPSVILDDWRSMEGRVACVAIRERPGGPQFGVFVMPQTTAIEIDYERPEDRDACRPSLEALAAALEYDILTEEVSDEDLGH